MPVRRRLQLGGRRWRRPPTLAPWTIRNAVVFDHPVLLSSQLDITLAAANNDQTYAANLPDGAANPMYAARRYPCVHDATPPAGDESTQAQWWRHVATTYMRAHASSVPAVAAARVALTWDLYRPLEQAAWNWTEGYPTPASEAWLWWFYVLATLAVAGVVICRRRGVAVYPLLSLALAVTVAAAVTYGNLRFRAEAEVAVVTLAAVTIDAVLGRWLDAPRRTAPAAGDEHRPAGEEERRPAALALRCAGG